MTIRTKAELYKMFADTPDDRMRDLLDTLFAMANEPTVGATETYAPDDPRSILIENGLIVGFAMP